MSAQTQHKETRRYVVMARKSLVSALYWLDRDDSDKVAEHLEESASWARLAASRLRGMRPTPDNPNADEEVNR